MHVRRAVRQEVSHNVSFDYFPDCCFADSVEIWMFANVIFRIVIKSSGWSYRNWKEWTIFRSVDFILVGQWVSHDYVRRLTPYVLCVGLSLVFFNQTMLKIMIFNSSPHNRLRKWEFTKKHKASGQSMISILYSDFIFRTEL